MSRADDQPTWKDLKPKQSCAYIKFLLERCKKENHKCTSYKRALQECEKGHPIFAPLTSQGYTMLSGFFMENPS